MAIIIDYFVIFVQIIWNISRQEVVVGDLEIRYYAIENCKSKGCNNREPTIKRNGRYYGKHALCRTCGKHIKEFNNRGHKCKLCDNVFCRECSIGVGNRNYDPKCAVNQQLNDLCGIIFEILQCIDSAFNIKICNIMGEYANGYLLICCNEFDKCDNKIFFDNILQWIENKDCENKEIYYYEPKYFYDNKPTVMIDSRKYRILCNKCTANKLVSCTECSNIKETIIQKYVECIYFVQNVVKM